MLLYRASLPLSRSTLKYVTGVLRRHRARLDGKDRALSPGMQALMVLVHLRKGETFAELGAGFGVSTTTAWRYVNETVELLAARSPKLAQALRKAVEDGLLHLVLDGTLIPIDRVAADRPFYSGKHRKHGMNLQVIAAPDGTIVWVSGAPPGAVHDLKAARIWGLLRALKATGLLVLADKGTTARANRYSPRTRAATSPSTSRTPTGPTPGCAAPACARMRSSKAGGSSANCGAARTAPAA